MDLSMNEQSSVQQILDSEIPKRRERTYTGVTLSEIEKAEL